MKKNHSRHVLIKAGIILIWGSLLLWEIASCKVVPPSKLDGAISPVKLSLASESHSDQDQSLLDWGVISVDEQGALQGSLIVSRDYVATGASNKGERLPKCFAPLTDDIGAIARGDCIENPTLKVSIFPRNVNQECYTHPDNLNSVATEPLKAAGCKTLRILGYRFDPEIRISIDTTSKPSR